MFELFFTQPIYNVIILIFALIGNMGAAIIIFSILIRLVLWPLSAKTIHSQKKMQDLQPQIAAIKISAAGDKQKESQLLLELYKEKGVNPFSSCLPLLIQLPFLFAVFHVFRDLRIDEAMLYGPIKSLGLIEGFLNGNGFHPGLFGIDLTSIPIHDGVYQIGGILLALFMGATQYIQTKILQPDKPDQTQAFVKQFTLILPAFLVYLSLTQFPVALTLYWTVYNIMAAVQQQLILKGDVAILEALPWKRKSKTTPKES